MKTAQPNRRLVRWLLGCALGLCLLMLGCLGLWFWLPAWAPATVARHSPWVEPVVRAGIHLRGGPYWRIYDERFCAWGPSAYPTLSRLLQGDSRLRQAALDSYQLIVPYSPVSGALVTPRDWGRVVVNVNTIHENGRQWWIARMNNLDFELADGDRHRVAVLAPLFERMREWAERLPHPRLHGRQVAKLVLELRCDRLVPYRIVDALLRLALESRNPDGALIASAYLTTRRDEDASTLPTERVVRLVLMPAGTEAWPITLTTAVAGEPSSALTIAIGDRPSVIVTGEVDGKERRDAITKALPQVLSENMRLSGASVRGSADCRWADVVTAVVAAAVLCESVRDRSRAEEPSPLGNVTLALMPDNP